MHHFRPVAFRPKIYRKAKLRISFLIKSSSSSSLLIRLQCSNKATKSFNDAIAKTLLAVRARLVDSQSLGFVSMLVHGRVPGLALEIIQGQERPDVPV